MDTCSLPDWNYEVGLEFPAPTHRKPFGSDNELVELLWQNGEVVLQSQNHRKPSYDPVKSKQPHKQYDQSTSKTTYQNPNTLIQDEETVSWIDCPIDESFDKEFCTNLLSEIPLSNPVEPHKLPAHYGGEKVVKFGASDTNNHVFSNSRPQDFAQLPLPPPRFEAFDARIGKAGNHDFSHKAQDKAHECSAMTIGSSHCASNQVENYTREVNESTGQDTLEQPITSSSGGSGSSFWKTSDVSNETNRCKRKKSSMEESQCQSDATQMESASGNKSSQKPGTSRRSRVAEVHNLSERRRRDRINEKMRALQELIPHSSKSDKASMLDEAIEYMKSLQLQLQLMWMGRGMAPMMLPGMQQYMSRLGMGIGPPTLPAIQNFMRLSRLPLVDQAMTMAPTASQVPVGHNPMLSYQNQMQSSHFPEQYANYMTFHSMQNTPQPLNMFNFRSHSTQQNHVLAPPNNGSGSVG